MNALLELVQMALKILILRVEDLVELEEEILTMQ